MTEADPRALLVVFVIALGVTAIARRYALSAPLLLVVVGLAMSFVPGIPVVPLDPDLVLFLVLPPLLYSAALESSTLRLRENMKRISQLAIGLVVFSTAVVGIAAWLLVPDLPLASALVLGAVVAPPDAVAAASIGRRLGLQRRLMTILEGESLLNDATALTLFRVLLAVAIATTTVGTGVTIAEGLGEFALAAVGGVALGAGLGWVLHRIRMRLHDGVLESSVGLLVPFAIYLLAEELHTSGVLAVVVAGLYLGHKATEAGYATRLQDQAVWKALDTLLEALVFALIGLQLRVVVDGLGEDAGRILGVSLALLVVTILARFVWVFPTIYLPRVLPKVRRAGPALPWRGPFVISWAGMRGVVTLAAAFAIPVGDEMTPGMPGRNIVVFVAFVITVGTLLLQGLTLAHPHPPAARPGQGWAARRARRGRGEAGRRRGRPGPPGRPLRRLDPAARHRAAAHVGAAPLQRRVGAPRALRRGDRRVPLGRVHPTAPGDAHRRARHVRALPGHGPHRRGRAARHAPRAGLRGGDARPVGAGAPDTPALRPPS